MKVKRDIDKEDEGRRGLYFLVIVAFIFSLLIAKLYYLQIIKGDTYKEMAFRNSLRVNVIKPSRGKIYDKNGEILADNITGYMIIHRNTRPISAEEKDILLKMKDNKEQALSGQSDSKKEKLNEIYFDISYISNISKESYEDILETFYKTPPQGFDKEIVVVEDMDQKEALKQVEHLPNDRIDIVEYNKRNYPYGKLASHVIGYVKLITDKEYDELKDKGYRMDDLIGKKGIEKQYDEVLRGKSGEEFVEVDVKGNIKKKLDEVSAISGDNIYLSIDKRLQEHMTNYMKNITGTFIAIDVKTGKIITFVSSPEIDSNLLSSKISSEVWSKIVNSKETPLVNKGIAGLYPPGSIYKVVTGAAILESGISPLETVNSTGTYKLGQVTFRDAHIGGYGITNFYKSIQDSVNTYYYEMLQRVPLQDVLDVAKNFGIGEKTGIDIPGEQEGLLPTPEWKKNRFKKAQDRIWLPGDLVNLSIGQGYLLVTPIQMLMIYQAIANNGVMLYPTIVDKFVDANGIIRMNPVRERRKLKISEKNLKIIQDALKLPVSQGTATVLKFPNVQVSAKTGTAQNSSDKNHSWIAGYFPSNKPEIAFVSFVQRGGYGSVAAGKQAREFIEEYYKKGEENGENK